VLVGISLTSVELQRQADGVQDALVDGLGEMPLQDAAGDLDDEGGIGGQGRLDVGGEPCADPRLPQGRHFRDAVADLQLNVSEAATVQTPSRWSRENSCSGWSDFHGGPNSSSRALSRLRQRHDRLERQRGEARVVPVGDPAYCHASYRPRRAGPMRARTERLRWGRFHQRSLPGRYLSIRAV
jgi:hypothetical protein